MSTLVSLHAYVLGFGLIGSWLVVAVWALILRLLRRSDTPMFWRMVSLAQVLLAVQLLVGLVLFAAWGLGAAGLPGAGTAWDVSWHVIYGIVFPLIVLLVAHQWSRSGRMNPHAAFALAGLVLFGLTARAWMVGLLGA